MQMCILKWLVSVSESESVSASERIRTFQLPHRGGSLKQGVWGVQPPRSYRVLHF